MKAIIVHAKSMPSVENVIDCNGDKIEPKMRVMLVGGVESDSTFTGTVTAISDADGDMDDEGRMVAILPMVYVRYDDETEDEEYTAFSTARGPGEDSAPYKVEDLVIINQGKKVDNGL